MESYARQIKSLLIKLYGENQGLSNFDYLLRKVDLYLSSLDYAETKDETEPSQKDTYRHLAGKVFAIAYPDNIYEDSVPTLQTLSSFLKNHFPSINGVHILPERLMSHDDVWPQDLFRFVTPEAAVQMVLSLQKEGILDENRKVTQLYEKKRQWLSEQYDNEILEIIESAYNSHFNDGGFSQKDRSMIDPRFGTKKDLHEICDSYGVMLDFVVNHLDIDNPFLDAYRSGEENGEEFIIITPDKYSQLKSQGVLEITFRPRPFPIFTGVRKYANSRDDSDETFSKSVTEMEKLLANAGSGSVDRRVIAYMSIVYKHANDQGLTSRDKRVFEAFFEYMNECSIQPELLFEVSSIQPGGKVLRDIYRSDPVKALCTELNVNPSCINILSEHMDSCFGELFYVYTTFSESQADINPLSEKGFSLIVDDFFHLLSSGRQSMMRMDAIKYLWKEIGKKNFDMEEGNTLIEIIRLIMKWACPHTLPLDEINSPDSTVYEMGRDGGFSYVFGQVNAVPIAINEGNIGPLKKYHEMMRDVKAPNLLPFVMLSTHDGRSVQGIGVQHKNGHVSIAEFVRFKHLVEKLGGKPKYRSVQKGMIPRETWDKAMNEAGIAGQDPEWNGMFSFDGDLVNAASEGEARDEDFINKFKLLGRIEPNVSVDIAKYVADWIYQGVVPYELCCTTRSSFPISTGQKFLTPEIEADRMLCAQAFVLTAGQCVPSIYVNDLLGLPNDLNGFAITKKPRDINRKKSNLSFVTKLMSEDNFTIRYIQGLNRLLKLRTEDGAFYPLSPAFDFAFYNDCVFLHHPYHNQNDSFVLGNILAEPVNVEIDMTYFYKDGREIPSVRIDRLTENKYTITGSGVLSAALEPFQVLWLK